MIKSAVDLNFLSDSFESFGVVVGILLVEDFEGNLLSGLVSCKFDLG